MSRHAVRGNPYIWRFIRKYKIAADLLQTGFYPNSKEITESFAAFDAINRRLGIDRKDPKVLCIVHGDGHHPRTGAFLVFRSKWAALSIDPLLRKSEYPGIKRLFAVQRKITFSSLMPTIVYATREIPETVRSIILVGVHSHASLKEAAGAVFNFADLIDPLPEVHAVSIPCCVPDDLDHDYTSYIDHGILSPKNRVNIYRNLEKGRAQ